MWAWSPKYIHLLERWPWHMLHSWWCEMSLVLVFSTASIWPRMKWIEYSWLIPYFPHSVGIFYAINSILVGFLQTQTIRNGTTCQGTTYQIGTLNVTISKYVRLYIYRHCSFHRRYDLNGKRHFVSLSDRTSIYKTALPHTIFTQLNDFMVSCAA